MKRQFITCQPEVPQKWIWTERTNSEKSDLEKISRTNNIYLLISMNFRLRQEKIFSLFTLQKSFCSKFSSFIRVARVPIRRPAILKTLSIPAVVAGHELISMANLESMLLILSINGLIGFLKKSCEKLLWKNAEPNSRSLRYIFAFQPPRDGSARLCLNWSGCWLNLGNEFGSPGFTNNY